MKLNKLYKKRSDGGIQSWEIEVSGNKYRTISGMVDGEKVTSEWTVCHGKNTGKANETTDNEQAKKEAQAAWDKKRNGSYKEDVGSAEADKAFKPMLAETYKDYKDGLGYPLWTQPKLDGIRCIADKRGLWTRNGKPHNNLQHIWEELKPLFEKYPDLIIDGEAYASHLNKDFNKIVSLVKQVKPVEADRVDSEKNIRYHVYDCFFQLRPDMGFAQRITKLGEYINGMKYSSKVPTHIANNSQELDKYYAEFLEAGYEGQMIRTNTAYKNKRTSALLKRKEFCDEEYTIADVEEGRGARAGIAGAILLTTGDRAGILGSHEYAGQLLQNKKSLIGKKATIRYQNKTPDGALRFPVMIAVRDYE